MADFEDRRKYLESLKDRLEALVAPKLIAAFNSHSSGMECACACVCLCVCVCACVCACVCVCVCVMCMH